MSLHIKRAELIDERTVDLTYEEDDGQEVVHRFTVTHEDGAISVLDGGAYSNTYVLAPGPEFPGWPVPLVRHMLKAGREPLPTGEEYDLVYEEWRRELRADWDRRHPPATA